MIIFPPQLNKQNPAILFIHEWRSSEKNNILRAEVLAKEGYICSTFDLPGHGSEQGDLESLTRPDFLDACIRAYDELAELPEVDKERISVVGSSLGSYLAVLLSSKRHVENLVLRVPADYPNHNFDTIPLVEMTGDLPEIKTWRSGVHGSEDSYALEALARFEGKVLLIESENDEIVPRQTILNYVNTLKDNEYVEHVVMKNQHHLLDEAGKEEFTLLLTGWFKKNF